MTNLNLKRRISVFHEDKWELLKENRDLFFKIRRAEFRKISDILVTY